ncbi:hypothetical protein BaRGS_00009327 [Batillaria attramentaria]|uniref:Uncharacterized protein n=1 Tax=Batillaria attramentaria TaxID=370345 RepID=A0ABD0LII6_9CAEN
MVLAFRPGGGEQGAVLRRASESQCYQRPTLVYGLRAKCPYDIPRFFPQVEPTPRASSPGCKPNRLIPEDDTIIIPYGTPTFLATMDHTHRPLSYTDALIIAFLFMFLRGILAWLSHQRTAAKIAIQTGTEKGPRTENWVTV